MQAVLILAHRQPNQVISLAKKLSKAFVVYIHFDKKMSLSPEDEQILKKLDNVNYFSKYDIKWGSFSIVKATLALIEKALANPAVNYLHLISGQDWPLKDVNKIAKFYRENPKIYLNYWPASGAVKSHEKLIWWAKLYYNYDQVNRRTKFGKVYHRLIIPAQLGLRIDKLKKYHVLENKIYIGEQWFDIPRDALEYALKKFRENGKWEKIFSTSFCSDEFWLPTMLHGSEYEEKIDKNIHRYIVWEKRHGSRPAILDETDLSSIQAGDYFWARKIVFGISDKLVEGLED